MNVKRMISLIVCLAVVVGFGQMAIAKPASAAETTSAGGYQVEAEDTEETVDSSGKSDSPTIKKDTAASGEKMLANTAGKGYIFKNIPQANAVTMRYTSTNTSTVAVYIEKNGEFELLGSIPFSTTQSWEMKKGWNTKSDMLYIPEGSTIKFVPAVDVNIDYFVFETKPLYEEKELSEEIQLAVKAQAENSAAADDIYSYTGKALELKSGGKVSFEIPSGVNCNVVNVRGSGTAIVKVSAEGGSGTIPFNSEIGDYKSYGVLLPESKAPNKITVELDTSSPAESVFHLDFVTMNEKQNAEIVNIGANAYQTENGGRSEISLDGIWECDTSLFTKRADLTDTVPEDLKFQNAICVPGMWDLADISMGDFTSQALWHKKTVVFDEAPDYQVILKIDRAQFGRYIYVNGHFVDEYQYNYTNSFTDISKYLVKGENEIVIMLGNWVEQVSDKSCPAHVLNDGEKQFNYPGIVDHVSLILNQSPWVHSVQVAPNIDDGTVQVQPVIRNQSGSEIKGSVEYKVYALGVLKNGELQQERKLVGSSSQQDQTFSADEDAVLRTTVQIEDFNESMLWTTDSPYLFEIEVNTGKDVLVKRFGMRTFCFDSETKLPMLNGKVTYLRGTNLAVHRFYDDVNRQRHPWENDWVRALYTELKDVNWNSFRIHMGSAPSDWYDLADEMGFLVADEYAWWNCIDGCTEKTLRTELHAWIDEKNTHPCIYVWDMNNEDISNGANNVAIKKNRDYDIQNRPWDNGWSKPMAETDSFECHPYLLSPGFTFESLNDFSTSYENPTNIIPETFAPNNPKILNEYGSIWLNREGTSTIAQMQSYYDSVKPDNTAEDRINIYADSVGKMTEFWRSGRHFAGILQFCALTYSKPYGQAVTGDILMPDLTVPKIHPEIKEKFRNAFAPLGICISEWTETCERGQELTVPVTLVNDYNYAVNDLKVTLTFYKADTGKKVKEYTQKVSLKAAGDSESGDRQVQEFQVKVPGSRTDAFRVVASYKLDGKTVQSERTWNITGGEITELPAWVLPTIIGGAVLVAAAAVAITMVCVKKRKKKIDGPVNP